MAQHAIVDIECLDKAIILSPERYDPRRSKRKDEDNKTTISDVAVFVHEQISPGKGDNHIPHLVLDTGDAKEGYITIHREPVSREEIGSMKRRVRRGDVIISRLRPYLHQVGYVDKLLYKSLPEQAILACSSEFFILRSRDSRSIAFLVPYLLTPMVQEILCASQEGGHHPRFNQETLEKLPLPNWLLRDRDDISAKTESLLEAAREADLSLRMLIMQCTQQALEAHKDLLDFIPSSNRAVKNIA